MSRTRRFILGTFLLALSQPVHAQDTQPYRDPFTSEIWCRDSGTACWLSPGRSRFFNGVRVIADVDLRILLQRGQNRFVAADFAQLPKLAVEVNIYQSWAAFQIALRGPGNIVLDTLSEARGLLTTGGNGSVPTDWGLSFGLTFFDSSIALVRGNVRYDSRVFRVPPCSPAASNRSDRKLADDRETARLRAKQVRPDTTFRRLCVRSNEFSDSYVYVAFQPLSGLRSAIKRGDPPEGVPNNTTASSQLRWP